MTLSGTCIDAEPFVLQVLDDSMEPEFKRGCVVVIDPTGVARDGSFVVAERSGEIVLRQLVGFDEELRLMPLNSRYPTQPLPDGVGVIRGVVVQRAGRRRNEHKRYD